MKTNTGVFVVFKTKRELKCQFSGNIVCLFSLLRFFDVIIDDPFFDVVKRLRLMDWDFSLNPKLEPFVGHTNPIFNPEDPPQPDFGTWGAQRKFGPWQLNSTWIWQAGKKLSAVVALLRLAKLASCRPLQLYINKESIIKFWHNSRNWICLVLF